MQLACKKFKQKFHAVTLSVTKLTFLLASITTVAFKFYANLELNIIILKMLKMDLGLGEGYVQQLTVQGKLVMFKDYVWEV